MDHKQPKSSFWLTRKLAYLRGSRGLKLGIFLAGLAGVTWVLAQGMIAFDRYGSDARYVNSFGKWAAPAMKLKAIYFPPFWLDLEPNKEMTLNDDLTLEHFEGQAVVLNFWASWCGSCAKEAHLIQDLWERHGIHRKGDDGIVVIGVVLNDELDQAKKYATENGKTYFLAHDSRGRLAVEYGITGIPETVFIAEDHRVYEQVVGSLDSEYLEGLMKDFSSYRRQKKAEALYHNLSL